MLLLEGGRVLCPESGLDALLDVRLDGDRIVEVGRGLSPGESRRLDCRGRVIAPGFVDLGTQLCDPGEIWREDLESGSQAGAAGGFTTLLVSPDTHPVLDDPSVASDVLNRAARVSGARLEAAGALTKGLAGEELAEMGLVLEAGCIALSDGGVAIPDTGVLRRALEYARPYGVPVMLRPSDESLERGGVMHHGDVSLRIGLRGIPPASEEIGVSRAIALCELTGTPIHLTAVTTARALALVAAAQAEGLPITAGVPARSLVLTDEAVDDLEYDTSVRVLPPLRPETDRRAAVEALRSGVICAVSADHVPWSRTEKEVEFEYAPFGAMGLETAFRATLSALDGDLALTVKVLGAGPRSVLRRTQRLAVGQVADLVVLEVGEPWPVRGPFRSRGINEPLVGRSLLGKVHATVVGGRVAFGPIANWG